MGKENYGINIKTVERIAKDLLSLKYFFVDSSDLIFLT